MLILKGRVIDGNGGEPIERGVVVLEDDKIVAVCQEHEYIIDENRTDIEILEVEDGTIMPGFIDCHTHLTSIGMMPEKLFLKHKYISLIEAVADAKKTLDAGFTSAREMCEFGPYLKNCIDRGIMAGPKLFVSGKLLSSTSGHGDVATNLPIDFVQKQNTIAYLVDGVDECLKGVRMNFREGADFIKTCSTGGVMSSGDDINTSEFSLEELKVMVEEAKRHNTYVASHSQGTAGIYKALQAGITSIEHGIFLDERCVELMVKNDCTYDPTLSILKILCGNPDEIPPFAYEKACRAIEGHHRSVELARNAGVRITLGSDFLGGDSELTQFGGQGIEFVSLVEAGLTPMEAIVAGTKNGAHLMRQSDLIGTLEVGKMADAVIVKGNPLNDITLLSNMDNVKYVVQSGKTVKAIQ